jgi:hypothetical protein
VIALPTILTVTLIVTVGWPDLHGSLDGFSSGGISSGGAFAVVALLCWIATGVFVIVACLGVVRRAGSERGRFVRRWWRLALVSTGIALLTVGIAHRQEGYRVCCASLGTAQQAEQLAR